MRTLSEFSGYQKLFPAAVK